MKEVKLSSAVVPPKTNYAVGVLREKQLHLTPLHAICRMRPNLEHVIIHYTISYHIIWHAIVGDHGP